MFIQAQKNVPFYVNCKQLTFNFNFQYCCQVPSTIPEVEDKSLKTQYQVSYVLVGAI